MIPFLSAAGTSSQVTKMLVELVLCPLTFKGAADGSDINEVRTALNNDIINDIINIIKRYNQYHFFNEYKKKIVTAYIRSGTGQVCVGG